MDPKLIISKYRLAKYHREFERIKISKIRQRLMFLRIDVFRILQSAFIILQNRGIWLHVMRGLFNALVGRKAMLRSLEIAITYRCNARCQQCSCYLSYDAEREIREKLTIDEIKKAIDEAAELGAFQFALNGGEPMLEEEKVYVLTEYIKKYHGRYVHLCTNGTLLTEAKIAKLKSCGLDSLEMGFDSVFQDVHDKNRIQGSHEHILENIRYCKKYGIKVILNTILTNEKVKSDDIISIILYAKKIGCLLQITPCCLTGRLKNRMDMMLTEEAKLYFHWLLSKSWNNRSDLYSSLTSIKCPAAREKIGLQPYGDIVSCPLIQISYGNIRDRSLKSIQADMLKNPYYSYKDSRGCLPSMNENFIKEYLLSQ